MSRVSEMRSVAAFLLLLPGALWGAEAEVERVILPNGVRMLLAETEDELLAVAVFIRGGSSVEPGEQAGATALTLRTMFLESDGWPERSFYRRFEQLGATLTTQGLEDYAVVNCRVPRERFPDAMRLLFTALTRPRFSSHVVEREKRRLAAELRGGESNKRVLARDLLARAMYVVHPYSHPPSGEVRTVQALEPETLARCHRQFFRPERMTLVIAGRYDPEDVRTVVREGLGGWTPRPVREEEAWPEPITTLVERTTGFVLTREGRFRQAAAIIGVPVPEMTSPDYPALKVAAAVLGRGMGSRLFRKVRSEAGYAYHVTAAYPSLQLTSQFTVYLEARRARVQPALDLVWSEIAVLREHPVGEPELAEAKAHLKGRLLAGRQGTENVAWVYGFWEALGRGWEYEERYPQELDRVTAEDVRRVMARYVLPGRASTVVIQPQ